METDARWPDVRAARMIPDRTFFFHPLHKSHWFSEDRIMQPWQIGVFASVDAGLGVHLDVAQELGIPTVQVHSPHKPTRTQAAADSFLAKCRSAGITVTCVFGGFDVCTRPLL